MKGQFRPVSHLQLLEHVGQVMLDGLFAERKTADILVAATLPDQAVNLGFPFAEAAQFVALLALVGHGGKVERGHQPGRQMGCDIAVSFGHRPYHLAQILAAGAFQGIGRGR